MPLDGASEKNVAQDNTPLTLPKEPQEEPKDNDYRPEHEDALTSNGGHRDDHASTVTEDTTAERQEVNQSPDLERHATEGSTAGEPYTIFTKSQRYLIIAIATVAGFISPLSANIYFPALNSIAESLNVSIEKVNLTLTTYIIFQGLAPMFVGSIADTLGRRPAYVLTFAIYVAANIGLAIQNNYVALLILRCVQSSGSSGTIALTFASVADISTSAERGTYMGLATSGIMLGPSIGPILGGILSQYLGWHSIFWFLTIVSFCVFVLIVVFLPETGRNVVGNGSIPPPVWGISLISYLHMRQARRREATDPSNSLEEARKKKEEMASKRKFKVPNPLGILTIVFEKDVGILLFLNSLIFIAFYCVITSLPEILKGSYGFNDLQIGLSFIPFGFGGALASILNGKILDWNFRRVAKQHGITINKKKGTDMRNFPIEKARMQCGLPALYLGVCFTIMYGWLFDYEVHYIAPLIVMFFLGMTLNSAFNVSGTMLIDLYPQKPAMATAANNLVRCLLGAGATALIEQMIAAMGRGWCFTFVALVLTVFSSLMWASMRWGPKWREERYVRLEKQAQKNEETENQGTRESGQSAPAQSEPAQSEKSVEAGQSTEQKAA